MTDRQIEKMIYNGVKEIPITKDDFNKLKNETKQLIKLSRTKIKLIGVNYEERGRSYKKNK